MVGILYCNKSTLNYQKLKDVLSKNNIKAHCIDIETAHESSLEGCSLLINAMGSFVPEDKLDLLVHFFEEGHNMLHLGPTPFTYNLKDGKVNHRLLRTFHIVDDFSPIFATTAYVQTVTGERLDAVLTGLQGGIYHLCTQDSSGVNHPNGYLEHILDAYDAEGNLVAAPVLRAVTHKGGSMTFWNFDFDTALLQEEFWLKLFLSTVRREALAGNVLLSVDCAYARYYPTEAKPITIALQSLTLSPKTTVTLTVTVSDAQGNCVFHYADTVTVPFETILAPLPTESGLYKVTATVEYEDMILARKETGFLVLTDAQLHAELNTFSPMYIDEKISTDYCLVDGKPTPILGTTYFVTDVYRQCFYYMNAWLCDREMAQLNTIGFNTLRSGNWVYIADFYETDGSIGERGMRALQTFFLLAARHGFTVQFALGNVMLNAWDRGKSAIHNREMREKCMTLVRSFAEGFKDYPNVTLDIVNEPSYSMKGAWSSGRPSGEPEELQRYQEWLSCRYQGKIENLRCAWGESAATLHGFQDVEMPPAHLFSRGLCRTEQRHNHTPLGDFYAFTRHEFLDWTKEVRATVKKYAPSMLVTMGRDENLRAPLQQDEVLAGNTDMVCWHQWNYNSDILTEYLLNRVRGKISVAQELGMYKFDDIRGGKRHTDREMIAKLDKKLLYAMGNFIQWQSHNDPFLFELSENSLGLYRADLSPTPSLLSTKKLVAAEKNMQEYLVGRQYHKVKIATVYNTSYYFSVDGGFAYQGIRNHVYALYHCLKEQSDFMPEHLFTEANKKAIGKPNLIILPAMQNLLPDTWQALLTYVREGATLLVSGCIDKDTYFREDVKIGALDDSYTTRKLMNFEKITINGKEYMLHFRQLVNYADTTNLLDCGETAAGSCITEYALGKGTILYCPYPLELSSNTEAICACYEYAIDRSQAPNEMYQLLQGNPNILLLANSYEKCTVYTLLNEGCEDTISWRDIRSNVCFTATLPQDAGCKLWISDSGQVLEQFGNIGLLSYNL